MKRVIGVLAVVLLASVIAVWGYQQWTLSAPARAERRLAAELERLGANTFWDDGHVWMVGIWPFGSAPSWKGTDLERASRLIQQLPNVTGLEIRGGLIELTDEDLVHLRPLRSSDKT